MNILERARRSDLLRHTYKVPAYWWLGFLILLLSLLLRTVLLDIKPAHFDEGINGWFVDQMWKSGFYRYDPNNYHGPLFFYLLQFSELLMARSIVALRLVTALISSGIVLLVLLHGRWFGRVALWAALAVAISPAMVFYGRYAIHESLLIFCQILFLYGFIRWRTTGGRAAILCMAAGIVGCIATKETFFIFFGTWFIALALVAVLDRLLQRSKPTEPSGQISLREPVSRKFVITVILTAVFVLLALFSGFFANPTGIKDMFMAFIPWLNTGVGDASGHEKPFLYWLSLLWRYEWPMLASLITLPLLLIDKSLWSWRIAATGFGLFLAYSLIPYKTPWLIIGIILPLSFAFGFLIELGRSKLPAIYNQIPVILGILLLSAALVTTLRLNFRDYANLSEPYVYIQTTTDITRFTGNLESLMVQQPAARNINLLVIHKEPWPLPWLLGSYPGLAYGSEDSITDITADVVVSDQSSHARIESLLSSTYIKQPLKIRDATDQGWVYYRFDKFRDVLMPDIELLPPAVRELQ